jgi:hypothetical protein
MKQEGERGDENVSLHALVGLMIDRLRRVSEIQRCIKDLVRRPVA